MWDVKPLWVKWRTAFRLQLWLPYAVLRYQWSRSQESYGKAWFAICWVRVSAHQWRWWWWCCVGSACYQCASQKWYVSSSRRHTHTLLFLFTDEETISERLSDSPKVTQPESGKRGVGIHDYQSAICGMCCFLSVWYCTCCRHLKACVSFSIRWDKMIGLLQGLKEN